MSKVLAVLVTSLFAAGAYAQMPANAENSPITNTKPQQRAEARVDARPQTGVRATGGDEARSAESNPIATGRAANASVSKKAARNAKHPNRQVNPQGGTPN